MAEKRKSDLRLNRLRKQLAGTGGAPVVDFQRFNISGFDYKGQISSGFGEHGYGASTGLSFNFGKLILPGLFSLSVSSKISGEVGRRTMLILQRDYSEREASFNDPANQTWARESTIPPVALFNH